MGFIKFIFQDDTLIVNASRNFESLEKFNRFFKREIELLGVVGIWSPIAVDLDSGEYESSLVTKRMSSSNIEDYMLEHGYKYVDGVLVKRLSVTNVRKNSRNYKRS
tara:strand:- start:1366 stop:1683 length:318 start_codon:yes stop_codon:yes gene_type:complete